MLLTSYSNLDPGLFCSDLAPEEANFDLVPRIISYSAIGISLAIIFVGWLFN